MGKISATEYLNKPEKFSTAPMCVAFGGDAFLKQQVFLTIRRILLPEEDAEFSLTRFEGSQADFPHVVEELSTMAMFGTATRLIVIEDADPFVSKYRANLEDYLAKPSKHGVLLLMLGTFPSNTRLYKLTDASGFLVDCNPLTESAIPRWLVAWAKNEHKIECEAAAAEMLVDLIGPELGLLHQELAKLASSVPQGEKLTAEIVQKNVGNWRTRTSWDMLDLALAGNTPEAVRQLNMLFQAGENAVGLLAMTAYTLRKLAAATQIVINAEKQRRRIPLPMALEQAGVKKFALGKSEQQLKLLGRHRGKQLLKWLVQADLDMKGDSRSDPKLILETLIVRISAAKLQ
ncbi:MAG: DNA polymerase III subunit delta [Planctomycetaceae bacterium]|jgi:DNA polymerase-3 subunit delta|nr:DNA polymerase III subunit delta [Planctomycetaceae bacterium]